MSRTYYVSLTITVPEEDGHPDKWDWSTLLDLPWNDVILEDVKEIVE